MADDVLELADKLWRGDVDIVEIHPVGGTWAVWPRSPPGSPSSPASPTSRPSPPTTGSCSSTRARASWPEPSTRRCGGGRRPAQHRDLLPRPHRPRLRRRRVGGGVAAQGWPAPVVVAHDAVPARFDRYIETAGYNEVINQRQFSVPGLRWPTEYRYPDRTYARAPRPDVGGVAFDLHHARGETDDHTWTWVRRAPGAVLRRPLHLGLAQRRQSPEGAALPPRVGRGAARDGRARARGPAPGTRLPGHRGRTGCARRSPTPPSSSSPSSTRPSPS